MVFMVVAPDPGRIGLKELLIIGDEKSPFFSVKVHCWIFKISEIGYVNQTTDCITPCENAPNQIILNHCRAVFQHSHIQPKMQPQP